MATDLRPLDTVIRNVAVIDGSGRERTAIGAVDVGIRDGRISLLPAGNASGREMVDGGGLTLCPGFVDVHTHDDIAVLRTPEMLPKISQGVTTVIVGNCGISAAPVTLAGELPDPMNLLGCAAEFVYPTFAAYAAAVDAARPAVNVSALVGHTALRNNHLDRLDRPATTAEIAAMRAQLSEALDHGALGLSTGLAYASAAAATTEEVAALAEPLAAAGGIYTTHLRSEFDAIRDAMEEAFTIGRLASVPVVISHLKCAGMANWGRSAEVLAALEDAGKGSPNSVGCDCYPYSASSSTLDLRQVTDEIVITITWSTPHPEVAGRTLKSIAGAWGADLMTAARRLQPAGAVYYCMAEEDVGRILAHPATVIGSDGLPCDPLPHPRLWGAFPRVLGHYSRDNALFSLETAVHKMTGQPAARFGLEGRGLIRDGAWADLVLFDPDTVRDTATFDDPIRTAVGIDAVWVNGVLSYRDGRTTPDRSGRFLPRLLPNNNSTT